jgi:molybdate transport system substrate-binding protein
MFSWRNGWIFCAIALLGSCQSGKAPAARAKVTVGAAANLTDVFAEIGAAFQAKTGADAVFSYGSTAQLAQQIENGAPFDLFAAADTEHVDSLVTSHKLTAESRAVYARGQLALWIPQSDKIQVRELKDLASTGVRFIAMAQPELAPYGQATIEALKATQLWDKVKSKVVYASSISQAKQLAASGNADVAFTAYSLVLHDKGTVLKVDASLYRPIEQALAIVAASRQAESAQQFRAFVLGPEGRAILSKDGYLLP